MHHFVTKMCTHVHISVLKGALWDMGHVCCVFFIVFFIVFLLFVVNSSSSTGLTAKPDMFWLFIHFILFHFISFFIHFVTVDDDVKTWQSFPASLVLWKGNPPVTGSSPHNEPVMWIFDFMMTSSNENISFVTGPLWGASTCHRLVPFTEASHAEL